MFGHKKGLAKIEWCVNVTLTFRLEICVKMSIFKVDVQSDHLETKCPWVKVSQGKNVTVDVSSGSKCHSGRNLGGRNVKASCFCVVDHGEEIMIGVVAYTAEK